MDTKSTKKQMTKKITNRYLEAHNAFSIGRTVYVKIISMIEYNNMINLLKRFCKISYYLRPLVHLHSSYKMERGVYYSPDSTFNNRKCLR